MIAIYLSGTGNTKHCIEKLTTLIDENAIVLPLESENIVENMNALGFEARYYQGERNDDDQQ